MRFMTQAQVPCVQRTATPVKVTSKQVEYVEEVVPRTTIRKTPGFQRRAKGNGEYEDVPGFWNFPETTFDRRVVPREKSVVHDRLAYEDKVVAMPVPQVVER